MVLQRRTMNATPPRPRHFGDAPPRLGLATPAVALAVGLAMPAGGEEGSDVGRPAPAAQRAEVLWSTSISRRVSASTADVSSPSVRTTIH